jgi:hypothetical protein
VEVVAHALEALAANDSRAVLARTMTPAEAVADIRELRQGVMLGGARIRDLIDEGRRS